MVFVSSKLTGRSQCASIIQPIGIFFKKIFSFQNCVVFWCYGFPRSSPICTVCFLASTFVLTVTFFISLLLCSFVIFNSAPIRSLLASCICPISSTMVACHIFVLLGGFMFPASCVIIIVFGWECILLCFITLVPCLIGGRPLICIRTLSCIYFWLWLFVIVRIPCCFLPGTFCFRRIIFAIYPIRWNECILFHSAFTCISFWPGSIPNVLVFIFTCWFCRRRLPLPIYMI